MKKYLLLLSLIAITFASCKKDTFDPTKQAAKDDTAIKAYIATNKITATEDPSGVYYEVTTPGTGQNVTPGSTITATYSGQVLNGATFAPAGSSLTAIPLADLIPGFQTGMLHINAGGTILLIIPSGLAYGNNSPATNIPVNSILIYTVNLQNLN